MIRKESVAKIEAFLKAAPRDVLNYAVESNIPQSEQSRELRAAVAAMEEAEQAFASARAQFLSASAALTAGVAARPLAVEAVRSAAGACREHGHAALGHYIALVSAAGNVPALVLASLMSSRKQTEAALASRRAELEKELLALGFIPTGVHRSPLYGVSRPALTIPDLVAAHPDVSALERRTLYHTPAYVVSPAATKAAEVAADLLTEIELDGLV